MKLPTIKNDDEYDRFIDSFSLWREAVAGICSKHEIPASDLVQISGGANLITLASKKFIIKIFPPFHEFQWQSECQALFHLKGAELGVFIPNLIAKGKLDNHWTYIVMTKLEGVTLDQVWEKLTDLNKQKILSKIGEVMRKTHNATLDVSIDIQPSWDDFIGQQLKNYLVRHKHFQMPSWFLSEVEDFVEENMSLLSQDSKSVLLTGEYTPFNLMTQQTNGEWTVTGMIDFGDSFVGDRLYDFLGPSLFLCDGKKEFVGALFAGYGLTENKQSQSFQKHLMLLQILHRYSNFRDQLQISEWEKKVSNFDSLYKLIWPI